MNKAPDTAKQHGKKHHVKSFLQGCDKLVHRQGAFPERCGQAGEPLDN